MKNIHSLTGLRFLAAMWVLGFHTLPTGLKPPWLSKIIGTGYVGVCLFFVLSGFILGYNYLDQIRTIRYRDFLQSRFARIYPLYIVAIVIGLLTLERGVKGGFTGLVEHLVARAFLIHAWFPSLSAGINTPTWSLSVEAFFYLLFPLLAIWACRLSSRSATLLYLVATAVGCLTPLLLASAMGWPNGRSNEGKFLEYNPILHLPTFIAGVLLVVIYLKGKALVAVVSSSLAALIAALSIGVVCVYKTPASSEVLHHGGLIIPFSILILHLAEGKSVLCRFLSSTSMVKLGEASYAVYLIHLPVWHVALKFHTGSLKSAIVVWIVYTATVIGLSLLLYRKLELPARNWLRPRQNLPQPVLASPLPEPSSAG